MVFLARDKGFEPLTFWSVDMVFSFYILAHLFKKLDFMRFFSFTLWRPLITSCNFVHACARNVHEISTAFQDFDVRHGTAGFPSVFTLCAFSERENIRAWSNLKRAQKGRK